MTILPGLAISQAGSKVSSWIESQEIDEKLVISGWCNNGTSAPLYLFYRAVMVNGDSLEVRESSTLSLPGQPTLLLKAVFVVQTGGFESITLDIFDKNELVASAILSGKTPKTLLPPERTDTPPLTSPVEEIFNEIEVEGLILDETRSKLAHDFYELFYNIWTQADSTSTFNTLIFRELPARTGLGARVVIELNEMEFMQIQLQPRQDILEEIASQLVEALKNYLENPDQSIREIEAEELQGTGIY
jgi:curli production assembly/transport component CsgE